MRIFISYSHDDQPWVLELWRALRDRAHYDAWIDQRIVPAEDWWDSILTHAEQADVVVYVMTPRAVESIYCLAEVHYALALNKPIIPLMLKTCSYPTELKRRRIQYATIDPRMALGDVLFEIERAMGEIRVRRVQGDYTPPDPAPPRPDEPRPERQPEQVAEVFVLAEEAASKDNWTLAEKLFKQVMDADPDGYGRAAAERLGEIRYERDRAAEYLSIVQMAANPKLQRGALALWRVFVDRYGAGYDPQGLAAQLDEEEPPDEAPPSPDPTIAVTSPADEPEPAEPAEPQTRTSRPQAPLIPVADLLPPPFEWVNIPAGRVGITNHGAFDVATFAIAKYPITNAQFQVFAEAENGYRDPQWWDFSTKAKKWRADNARPRDTAFAGDDLPRTNVCWYEAVAFCRWLSARSGEAVRLPSEQEWQRAAQGDDGREYPWGDQFDASRCNTEESGIGQPTPVTAYPNGASPYGVLDMSGNVWEWCVTANVRPARIVMGVNAARRALRGGSWDLNQNSARAVYRVSYNPDDRNYNIGFRVVRSPSL